MPFRTWRLIAGAILTAAAPVSAIDLTAGRLAKFVDSAGVARGQAVVKFVDDPAIAAPLPDPTGVATAVRLRADASDTGDIALDPGRWSPTRNGFRYDDKSGSRDGIRKIVLKTRDRGGRLLIKAAGAGYAANPILGPAGFVEVTLTVGATTYCGRFQPPLARARRNDTRRVVFEARTTSRCQPPPDFTIAEGVPGPAELPVLAPGRPADLSLLGDAERAAVDQADARSQALRTRPLRLFVDQPGADVAISQTRHGFPIGIAVDLRKLTNAGDRAWFAETAAAHFNLAVIENTAKWRPIEPQPGVRDFAAMDDIMAWAGPLGLAVKGHALQWGNAPPLSSSGIPQWVLDRFPSAALSLAEQEELRELIRQHVMATAGRYRGRIRIWDVTNETLHPFALWFIDRLGPQIVEDIFHWAREADPEAQLVFNEWILEVFTGMPRPTAAQVRDRVIELVVAGVPVDAVGIQAHFVPGAAYFGVPVDLTQRTRLDDYARALDTLAEAGLPIHITEINVIAPEDPELRAAQLEGFMRLWWGHPAVEQINFWSMWNALSGRKQFNPGLWANDKTLSRHGEAAMSLLNERWRTITVETADAEGFIELPAAHLGGYAAEWTVGGATFHAAFDVGAGSGPAGVALLTPQP